MLLTRKPAVQDTKTASQSGPTRRQGAASLAGSLARGLAGALPTMDRRTFLKRSGIGVGAGLAATQLSLVKKSVVGEAQAAEGKGDIVVRRNYPYEQGQALEAFNWYGVIVAAKTPPETIARLREGLHKALNDPDLKEKLVSRGADPIPGSTEQFAAFLKDEIAKWGRIVRESGAKAD